MDTPLAPNPVQDRRGKKHRLDLSSPVANDDLSRAVDLIINDQSLPPHLKAAVGCMLEIREQLNAVVAKNKELMEENIAVCARNVELENEVLSLKSQINVLKQALTSQAAVAPMSSVDISGSHFHEDVERKRSVVIIGVNESSSPVASDRVLYDAGCVRRILDFLSIDCRPVAIYRMGRFIAGKARLLKVVFPASFFASLSLKRASYLRHFPEKGVYIRPSLSKPDRDRLRAERLARLNSTHATRSDRCCDSTAVPLAGNGSNAGCTVTRLDSSQPPSSSSMAIMQSENV